MKKSGLFDDMKDDIPAPPATTPRRRLDWRGIRGEPLTPEQRAELNRDKNKGRKYKPQKGRMLLVLCNLCEWKCRTSQKHIDAIRVWKCPACERGKLFQGD